MTDLELNLSVVRAREHLESLWYNVAYIGIYGSQNYWLAEYTEEYMSDIDYKAVIVPTLDDLVYNAKPKSTTIDFEGGQIDLKDIRVFTDTLVKCNPAYVEILYTKYSSYTKDFEPILLEREQLVSEMWQFLLKACYGMIMEKIKAFSHPYPSIVDKVEKYWYDPKQLHHIVRLEWLMKRFVSGDVFDMSNKKEDIEFLMRLKKGFYTLEQAEEFRDRYDVSAKALKENYITEPKFNSKGRVVQYSKDLIKNKIIAEVKWKIRASNKGKAFCPICLNNMPVSKVESPDVENWMECKKCKTQFNTLPV